MWGAAALGALPVALPTLDQQRRVADFLDEQVVRLDAAGIEAALLGRSLKEGWKAWLDERMCRNEGRVLLASLTDPVRPSSTASFCPGHTSMVAFPL